MNDQTEPNLRTNLAVAMCRIFRPVVKLLIRNGVSFKSCAEWLRWTYVDVAYREFQLEQKKQTKSRIAVLTGLSRVEVDRLLNSSVHESNVDTEEHHRAARVLTGWVHDQRFCNAEGKPLSIPFEDNEVSFSRLVELYGGGIPPRSVLDELVRVKCVRVSANREVHLLRSYFIADESVAKASQLDILGFSVAQLLETVNHNLYSGEATRLQLVASEDHIPVSALPVLREKLQQLGRECISEADDCLFEEVDGNGQTGTTSRIGLGVYFFEQPQSAVETDHELMGRTTHQS